MAKDDYFVVLYRVLRYLYACLKAGETAEPGAMGAEALGIHPGYWRYLMEHLAADGYASGIEVSPAHTHFYGAQITPAGIEYLLENRMMQKAADALRPFIALGA